MFLSIWRVFSVAAHGAEEGPRPPLLPFERLLVPVFHLPSMLVFEFLGLVLIFPGRVLVTRPVEVDHVACARVFQRWLIVV